MNLSETQEEAIAELQLLTAKPVLYVCNVGESEVNKGNAYVEEVRALGKI